jgi:hypothetical protein
MIFFPSLRQEVKLCNVIWLYFYRIRFPVLIADDQGFSDEGATLRYYLTLMMLATNNGE